MSGDENVPATWVATPAEHVQPGDVLPVGRVLAKAWGAPIGIDAWRVVVDGALSPYWIPKDDVVLCQRAAERVPRGSARAITPIECVVLTDVSSDARTLRRGEFVEWARMVIGGSRARTP